MKLNPIHDLARSFIGEPTSLLLESLEGAHNVLIRGADVLREQYGAHDFATILEEQAAGLLEMTESVAEQVLAAEVEPDVWPSVEEEFAAIWQDYLQWQGGRPSSRGEESYGTKKRLARLLRHVLIGIPGRKDVSADMLIAAAQDVWQSRRR